MVPRARECGANQRENDYTTEYGRGIVERQVGMIPIDIAAKLRRQVEASER
jgi:hypothetical protein